MVEFHILGPLEIVDDEGRASPVRGEKVRRLLALLLISPNRVVSTDRLVDQIWDDMDVDAGLAALRVNMSRLRKTLGPHAATMIATRAPGYVLEATPDQVDALRFERGVAAGRTALAVGQPAEAAAELTAALALWRGPALADLADWPPVVGAATQLEELRLAALEDRVEADLACGRHAVLVGELEALTADNPLRERLWAARILALYRAGRQADALRAYQSLHTMMGEELGLEPSPELRRLEQLVLAQDPSLDTPAAPSATTAPADSAAAATTVMLVDDHPMWREAIRSALERSSTATVVAEAEDGEAAVQVAIDARPDVILMDLHLPRLHGTDAARRILAEHPSARILMLSSSGEEADVLEAVKAGAQGYLLKTGTAGDVVDAVTRVATGEPVFTPSLAGVVLGEVRGERPDGVTLSSRQREVLRLLSGGESHAAIARALGIGETDVRGEIVATVAALQGTVPTNAHSTGRALRSVLFVDVVGSTAKAAEMGDAAWHTVLQRYHGLVADRASAHGGHAVSTAGDGVLVTFERPGDAIAAALDMTQAVGDLGLDVRAGLHMGECEVTEDDVHGLAVHIGARVAAHAAPGEVLVSHTVHDLLLGSGRAFDDRGVHPLKGVPGQWRLFAVAG